MSNWPEVVMILAHNYGGGVRSTVVKVIGSAVDLGALADAMDVGKPLTIDVSKIKIHNGRNYVPVSEWKP
jgi:hypothetical protein